MKMKSDKRAIDKIFRRRDRYEIPDWQREKVWPTEKKQNLIDSILRGWKLPKFYFLQLSEQEFEVVDGQQRLTAIFEFFENELELSKQSAKEFRGSYYRDLSSQVADRFDDFEIEFDLIEDADERELKEFFQRLQEGLPLTSSEKLNSVHSKLRDYCRTMAGHKFFSNKVGASNKRYGHFDIMSKVMAIEIEGIDVGLRFDDIKAVFESQENFSSASNVAKRVKAALEHLDGCFSDDANLLKNRTIVQSFITLTCKIVATGRAAGTEKTLGKFFERFSTELSKQVELGQTAADVDYIQFQRTVNANVRSGAAIRQKILLRKLISYAPQIADIFGSEVFAESDLSREVARRAENLKNLITEINAEYAAHHGVDLFKVTNKTLRALTQIGRPIRDFFDYQTLIDNLYFIFKEGPGSKLVENVPPSFIDVNTLRTEIRHDVDHGEDKKVRSKRKKAGETYKRYSGQVNPETSSPEKLLIAQANLLSTIEIDLKQLATSSG